MIEKMFKIMCNKKEFLTEEIIAQALLNNVTLKTEEPKVFFAVVERETIKENNNCGYNQCT